MPRSKAGDTPIDITSYDFVVIPIYTGPIVDGHWAMALLNPDSGVLRYFSSQLFNVVLTQICSVYDSQDPNQCRDWTPVVEAVRFVIWQYKFESFEPLQSMAKYDARFM